MLSTTSQRCPVEAGIDPADRMIGALGLVRACTRQMHSLHVRLDARLLCHEHVTCSHSIVGTRQNCRYEAEEV